MARRTIRQVGRENYVWDPSLRDGVGAYQSTVTNKIVSEEEVNEALTKRIMRMEREIDQLSRDLAQEYISLADWQRGIRDRMKVIYTYSGALAGGGWANMSNNDWLMVARASKFNYRKLQSFAIEIEQGVYPLTHLDGRINGRFLQRARQYGMAGRNVYYQLDRQRAIESGKSHLQSVRHANDSCQGCIDQEDLGIVPIDDPRIIPIGSRNCLRKCRCTYRYYTREQAVVLTNRTPVLPVAA